MWQKIQWKRAQTVTPSSKIPCPRWGHNCVVIGTEIVFFGGYADSHYMNDLWVFNSQTMQWSEPVISGTAPPCRSNFTMNYDSTNNRIVIFGGGGINKERFNSIYLIDWNDKCWIKVQTANSQSESIPWERTYHCAQVLYPYLITYGGQAAVDTDDLWVFNFENRKWTEIKMPADAVKPGARRFHSSALVGTSFYVIAGCYSRYRCLSDIYCLDLAPLLKTGRAQNLLWKEMKPNGSSFLTRWGHSSSVFNGKIFIFGGRFSNDLNDVLVYNPDQNTIRNIKVGTESPKARRRHCSGFMGSCMFIFGGFNGDYFNDMMYFNVAESNMAFSFMLQPSSPRNYEKYSTSNYTSIITVGQQKIPICQPLIAHYFCDAEDITRFLNKLGGLCHSKQFKAILSMLYSGVGFVDSEPICILLKKYGIVLYQSQEDKVSQQKLKIDDKSNEIKSLSRKVVSLQNPVLQLEEKAFKDYYANKQPYFYQNYRLQVNQNQKQSQQIKVNKHILAASCTYFEYFFSRGSSVLNIPNECLILLPVFLNYLATGLLVVQRQMDPQLWGILCQMAQYFCLPKLSKLCEAILYRKSNISNFLLIYKIATQCRLTKLIQNCAYLSLKSKSMFQNSSQIKKAIQLEEQPIWKQKLKVAYNLMRFDLDQAGIRGKSMPILRNKLSQNSQPQKENREVNCI